MRNEPWHELSTKLVFATSNDLDQPAQNAHCLKNLVAAQMCILTTFVTERLTVLDNPVRVLWVGTYR